MSAILTTTEIARPPEEVFAYVTDPTRFPEWQHGVAGGHLDRAPAAVGSRCTTIRRIGGSERQVISEITELDPPNRWADHGVEGPIRGIVAVTIEPVETGGGARVTIALDFEGHGIGRLLIPLLVRRQAAREMPANMRRLKERLEKRPPPGDTAT